MCTLQEAWPPPPLQRPVRLQHVAPPPQLHCVPPPPPAAEQFSRLAVVKEVKEEAEQAAVDLTVLIVVGFTVLFLTMMLGFSVYGSRLEKRMDQIVYMLMMIKSRA